MISYDWRLLMQFLNYFGAVMDFAGIAIIAYWLCQRPKRS
jgi:hypothetical protein